MHSATTHQCETQFSNNNLHADSAYALAELLQRNTLQELYLSLNGIGDVGVKAIATGLQHNTSLQRLDLFNNNVSDVGAKVLAAALYDNTSLQQLDLEQNMC